MLIRPAFPDELSRAKLLLEDHPIPSNAGFLVGVKQRPVERIVAAIPWWPLHSDHPGDGKKIIRFHLSFPGQANAIEQVPETVARLEEIAAEHHSTSLQTDFPLKSTNPLYQRLIDCGFEIARTERYLSAPGEQARQRTLRLYRRFKRRIPTDWKTESIRGQDPEKIFEIVAAHGLLPRHRFLALWNPANRERFEEAYSIVLTCGEDILGLYLLSQRDEHELHIHVEAVNPKYTSLSPLISVAIRNAFCTNCPEPFPEIFTFRADSEKHIQTFNTALRNGGEELEPRHFLKRKIKEP